MKKQFKDMLYLMKYAAFDKKINIQNVDSGDNICKLAIKQGVFPLVYDALVENGYKSISSKYTNIFFAQIVTYEQKMYCLYKVAQLFNENNLNFCILKGCTIASLYHLSEYRMSGDVDLLIAPQDEKKAAKLLSAEMEMLIVPRSKEGHHFLAKHKTGGLFEIHIALYNSMFDDMVLKNTFQVNEPFLKQKLKNGLEINSLSINDNLYYLTAHLIKHFVKEGCGIRQILDLLVYVNTYCDKIDFDKYFVTLHKIGFDRFIKNIFGIGVTYFELSLPVYEVNNVDEILNDVEIGGNFGFSDEERAGFYNSFLKLRNTNNPSKDIAHVKSNKIKGIIRSVLMPNKDYLISKGYLYLKNHTYLYPVAYIHRIIDVLVLVSKRKRGLNDFKLNITENDVKMQRIELMRKLEIIGGNNQ